MKELTIKQKAKAYDEAIERAKGVIEQNPLMEYLKKGIEYIFPSLKESEDEKIRKKLINYFSNVKGFSSLEYNYGITGEDAIAWLEKQGENNMGISEKTKQELEDNLNKALEKETPESCNEFLEKQGEQKPAWSKEDIELLDNTIKFIEDSVAATSPSLRTYSPTLTGKEIPFLKALKDRVQPKQELSEEDEKDICEAAEYLRKYSKYVVGGYSKRYVLDLADRIESIIPQSQWKPSEEQMKALKEACEEHWEPDGLDPLYMLWEQLKKLKE